MLRKVVKIDEEKCNGCALCVPSCAEGAIQVIDGKARLVSDMYCDGLGACLGECPQGAITVEEREADAFDEEAARRYVAQQRPVSVSHQGSAPMPPHLHACPGSAVQTFQPAHVAGPAAAGAGKAAASPSALRNWPVQLVLAPVRAPYFDGANLLIAADCTPFAFADFHERFLAGRTLLMGCPKLDDTDLYRRKLAQIFAQNDIRSIEVAYMEVPCCFGLVQLVRLALQDSGKDITLNLTKIGVRGEIRETNVVEPKVLACS